MIIGISGRINSGKDTIGEIIQYLTLKDLDQRPHYVIYKGLESYNNKVLQELSEWQIKKFAGKLKQVCSLLTGIPVEDFEKQEVKDRYLSKEWDREPDACMIHNKYRELGGTGLIIGNPYFRDIDNKIIQKEVKVQQKLKEWIDEYSHPIVRWLLQTVGTEAMRNNVHTNVWVNALFSDYKEVNTYYPNWIITDLRFPNEAEAIKERRGFLIRVDRKETDSKAGNHASETSLDNYNFDYYIQNDGTLEQLVEKVRTILQNRNIL